MLDVQKLIIMAMKKEIFVDNDDLNNVARTILAEMKTKFKDIKEEITPEIQYKMLQKMKKDRENSVKIYSEAYEKTNSEVAKDNLNKARNELEPINLFLANLESEMPKKLSECEIRTLVEENIEKFGDMKPNKGMIMKLFKARTDVDMSIVAKIVNSLL